MPSVLNNTVNYRRKMADRQRCIHGSGYREFPGTPMAALRAPKVDDDLKVLMNATIQKMNRPRGRRSSRRCRSPLAWRRSTRSRVTTCGATAGSPRARPARTHAGRRSSVQPLVDLALLVTSFFSSRFSEVALTPRGRRSPRPWPPPSPAPSTGPITGTCGSRTSNCCHF